MSWKYLLLASAIFSSCSHQHHSAKHRTKDGYITTPSGLKYNILQEGEGETVTAGREVLLFETTSYLDGTVLYSNENTTSPVKVLIGGNQATAAVDEGLRGMKTGEVRQLIAPAHLVKRKSYPPNVSPDSALSIKLILYKIL